MMAGLTGCWAVTTIIRWSARLFVVSVESLDEQDVAIRVDQQAAVDGAELPAMEKRDEQALLALIKGNID